VKAEAFGEVLDRPGASQYSRAPMARARSEERMDDMVKIRVTTRQKERLEEAAKREHLEATAWMRHVLLKEADRVLGAESDADDPSADE
jgi:hypothetical protein